MKEESSWPRQKPKSEVTLEVDIRPQEMAYGVILMVHLAQLCGLFLTSFPFPSSVHSCWSKEV